MPAVRNGLGNWWLILGHHSGIRVLLQHSTALLQAVYSALVRAVGSELQWVCPQLQGRKRGSQEGDMVAFAVVGGNLGTPVP